MFFALNHPCLVMAFAELYVLFFLIGLLTIENQDNSELSQEREVYPLVFSELLTYILGTKTSSDNPVVFLLVDLVSLSKQRFEQLGMKTHDVKAFFDKVQKSYTMKDMGNPFMEETGDLFTLDTKIIAHPSVAEMVASQYDNGKTRFNEFLKGLDTDEYSFYQPIKKNKTDFFQQKPEPNMGDSKQKTLKDDCRLFSTIFISCQSREDDLMEFFQHENL
jgi:hypothetical protein